jgi:hypothetical protein
MTTNIEWYIPKWGNCFSKKNEHKRKSDIKNVDIKFRITFIHQVRSKSKNWKVLGAIKPKINMIEKGS